MRNLLFISPRLPYPPDRGEKIRLWHVLRHLARTHRVLLGCLVDDPRDWQHQATVAALCGEIGCFGIDKRGQKLRALTRLRPGRPLMLDYYAHEPLRRWIGDVARREAIDLVYIFSTAMAPYALAPPELAGVRKILDMVDVDSEKWADYARRSGWPARLVWAREARTLLAYERQAALACARTLLVTPAECRRFADLAPESRDRVVAVENGVGLEVPAAPGCSPYPQDTEAGPWLTLIGNMDYWPNEDAARWFAAAVLPLLRRRTPPPRLAIVGANPGVRLRRLAAQPGILVTGRVADVRPYLAHAAVVVAPLRIARGVQNKVLEGMAAGRPVVASPQAFEGIDAEPGRDLLVADGAEAMAAMIADVLDGRHPGLGAAARRAVELRYAWPLQLARLESILRR